MIANISLCVIFGCMSYLVLNKRIIIEPVMKGMMCVMMISIIGILSKPEPIIFQFMHGVFVAMLAGLFVAFTNIVRKRGFL